MRSGPKHTATFLNGDPNFEKLRAELELQNRLLRQVRELLPPELASHCQAARIDSRQQLLLFTDNAVWASRLRFAGTAILAALRGKTRKRLHNIRTIVQPCGTSQIKNKTAVHSMVSAEIVRECAFSCPDPALRDALERLAASVSDRDLRG